MRMRNGWLSLASILSVGIASSAWAQEKGPRADNETDAAKAVAEGKTSLVQAVSAAEAAGKGKALSATVRGRGADFKITVQIWADGKRVSIPVDLKTGKAGDVAAPAGDATVGGERDKKVAEAMTTNKVTLGDAIKLAEEHSKGKAFRAIAMEQGDKLNVMVSCWANDKVMLCRVDPQTKEVTEEKSREERRQERRNDRNDKNKKGEGEKPAKP